jgi:hypothetical protein
MIQATTGIPACGMTLPDCAPAAQAAEGASTLYQLEYLDAAGSAIVESSFTAADAAVYLRSLLALGVSPVTVRVIA